MQEFILSATADFGIALAVRSTCGAEWLEHMEVTDKVVRIGYLVVQSRLKKSGTKTGPPPNIKFLTIPAGCGGKHESWDVVYNLPC